MKLAEIIGETPEKRQKMAVILVGLLAACSAGGVATWITGDLERAVLNIGIRTHQTSPKIEMPPPWYHER